MELWVVILLFAVFFSLGMWILYCLIEKEAERRANEGFIDEWYGYRRWRRNLKK